MNSTFSIRCQYGMRSLLMIGLAVYIITLHRTSALHYYLAPHMQKLLLLCPVPLIFIALAMAWHVIVGSRDGEDVCDCEHPLPQSWFKKTLVYGMLLIPLLFGSLLPNQALGSDMAAKKVCPSPIPTRIYDEKQTYKPRIHPQPPFYPLHLSHQLRSL